MKKFLLLFLLIMSLSFCFSSCEGETPEQIASRTITLSMNSVIMEVGDTLTLTATTAPVQWEAPEILWYSSDASIVECVGGRLTARSEGSCTIKAYTADGVSTATTVTVRAGILSLASVLLDIPDAALNYVDERTAEILSSAQIVDYSVALS